MSISMKYTRLISSRIYLIFLEAELLIGFAESVGKVKIDRRKKVVN
ncbi:hypothetical protein IPdc08_01130 [archaeon]|nr:hypothetical protein IPdc08_01130 [archaeon]